MIVVKNSIVSDDVADQRFCCDCAVCRGACCVDGDSGAPLLEEEVPVLEAILPEVRPYMTPEGIAAVEAQGVAVRDRDGDLGTPLIDGSACAFINYASDGTALCAIEIAHSKFKIQNSETETQNSKFKIQNSETETQNSKFKIQNSEFKKPLSCHLYPIRVEDYGEFTAVNYHRWDICRHAHGQGEPLYIYLKEPLVRRFGTEWYDELLQEIANRHE